jgi:hypothetical protein
MIISTTYWNKLEILKIGLNYENELKQNVKNKCIFMLEPLKKIMVEYCPSLIGIQANFNPSGKV